MMTIEKNTESFYVTGGTLRRDAACYVRRRADQALFDGLMQGSICYVLTSRQMGKSSLMVRTAARLREAEAHVVVLDLTAIGQNLSAEQWYDGLLGKVGQQLDLEDEIEEFWDAHARLSQLQRWMNALREVVLPARAGRIVIFVDEIDAVRSLPFPTDEFFAAIRELYNRRTEDPELERLTFCLLGVATPSDLIRDTRTTPFNIGQRIELNDFTDDEAAPLANGLGRDERTAKKLLKRILYWTGGHPYLTQRLCQSVAADANVRDAGGVDRLCEELFFTTRARERDDNLLFVRERLLKSEADRAAVLDLYKKLRDNQRVKDDETNPLISVLRLSGITRVVEGLLYVRNRIYYRVFDREWVLANLPDAEVQRQKAAYRRGLWRAATIAAVMLAVVSGLAFFAFWQRGAAKQQAEANRKLAYAAQMNLAGHDWAANNVGRVREMLNAHTPTNGQEDLRGFEWFYLWRGINKDAVSLKVPPTSGRRVSNDGKILAAMEVPGVITLWNIETGEKVRTLGSHESSFAALDFSPDDKKLYSLGLDRKLKTWNVTTGQEIRTVEVESSNLRQLVCLPDGKRLAMSGGGKISLRDAETGKELTAFQAHKDFGPAFMSLKFTPDGKYLATSGFDGLVKVWDVATLKEFRSFKITPEFSFAISFSPDGTKLAIAGHWIRGYDIVSGREMATFENQRDAQSFFYQHVTFSPDGNYLAADDTVNTVQVWEVKTGKERYAFRKHGGAGTLAFLPDSKKLWWGGDSEFLWWNLVPQEMAEPEVIKDHQAAVVSMSWAPDGKSFAASDASGAITIRDATTGKERAQLRSPSASALLWAIAFSPDGQRISAASEGKVIQVWDVKTKSLLRSFKTADASPAFSGFRAAFSPDVSWVASEDGENTIKILEVETGKELLTVKGEFGHPAFSPDGRLLALAEVRSGKLKLIDIASGKELSVWQVPVRTWSIRFSPDGESLAAGSMSGDVSLWQVKTGRQIFTTKGHSQGVIDLSFTPDGKRLATGGFDNKVKIWDTQSGQELLTLTGHTNNLQSVAFSPDGKTLLSAGIDKTIRLWRAATDAEVQARRGQ